MSRLALFFLLAIVGAAQSIRDSDSYVLRPVIGNGSRGDGGPAVNALLHGPYGLAEDSAGNIYISESSAGLIRRVRPDGTIERFAGTGRIGNTIEDMPALETDLLRPTVLAVDRDGGLLFADPESCCIRKVHTDGKIRNVVGNGRCATSSGGFGGGGTVNPTAERRALEADVGTVSGMVLDSSGRLIFSDETYHVVRRLDDDGYVRTVAGVGVAGFGGDNDLATKALLRAPRGLTFDGEGNLYIADGSNCRVRRINRSDTIETMAGSGTCATAPSGFSGTATRTSIGTLTGIAYDPQTDTILIASPSQSRVLRLDLAAQRISTALGDGRRRAIDTEAPLEKSIGHPDAILYSPRAGILVADATSFAVLQMRDGRVTPFAGFWPQLPVYPSASGAPMVRPRGLCITSSGSLVAVDTGAERVLRYSFPDLLTAVAGARSPTGYISGNDGPALDAQLNDIDRILCGPGGDLYLTQGRQIKRIDRQGTIRLWRDFLDHPAGMALDSAGNLLVADATAHKVYRIHPTTKLLTVIAGTGTAGFSGDGAAATQARIDTPGDIALDSKGNLLIADRGNRRIRRVSTDGVIETIAGSQRAFSHADISGELATSIGLAAIDGLAVDANDNVYIAEYPRISKIDTGGRIQILTGYVGEDDQGVKRYFHGPLNGCDSLAVDPDGRLYFSVREDLRVMVAVPKNLSEGGVFSSTAFGGFAAVAPGSWMEIYGAGLANNARQWSSADFSADRAPTSLDGVRVNIGGEDAFLAYISPTQVNAQVPASAGQGRQPVTVSNGGTAAAYNVTVNATQPGLLAPASFRVGNRQYVVAVLADGTSYGAPAGAIAGAQTRPGRPGETIVLYGIGFGSVTPRADPGHVVSDTNLLDLPVAFFFGQTQAQHTYAGLVPGSIGLYQFNVIVPAVAPGDAIPLSFTLDGQPGEQTLFIAIQN